MNGIDARLECRLFGSFIVVFSWVSKDQYSVRYEDVMLCYSVAICVTA